MSSYVTRKTPGDTEWFRHDRFGMFIHWGLYSLPARHEWVKNFERTPEEKYQKYFEHFNPDLYDPKEWARQAKAAGMKYVVLTTKHHEGFCMFDSQYTDYKCTNTPAGRDLVREYVDAFRAEGLHIGFYYSLIDWHHPEFPIDSLHPRRNDPNAEELDKGRDVHKYAAYMRDQLTELLTNYGKIDILWLDFSYTHPNPASVKPWMQHGGGKGKNEWESEKLIFLVRSLQPNIIIDNRADLEQDLWTPEQYQVLSWPKHPKTGERVTWEACQTFSGSWGYHRDEKSWKSPRMLIEMLINTVCIGGNLLMNVGPTSRGNFDKRADAALEVFGEWMRLNGRSIYGCTMADPELPVPRGCRFTQSADGKRLYVHLMEYPYAFLEMRGFAGKVDYAQFLHDGSEIKFTEKSSTHFSECRTEADDLLVLELPVPAPDVTVPVIEL
ncbi:MAG: alpha-L-fucosidase, partial [Candidatus Flemingibacterium sp.]|nr:alpha-L-fucosidase [Candidatus Flemingibacterium sp.]